MNGSLLGFLFLLFAFLFYPKSRDLYSSHTPVILEIIKNMVLHPGWDKVIASFWLLFAGF